MEGTWTFVTFIYDHLIGKCLIEMSRVTAASWWCCSVVSNSLPLRGLQHVRFPCPSLSPGVCSNLCPLSQWCYLTISSSATPFSICLQYFPTSRSFPMSPLFASGGQSTGASFSFSISLSNEYSGLTSFRVGLILLSKGLSKIFSSTTIQKHKFLGTQSSLQFASHIHTWLLEKP